MAQKVTCDTGELERTTTMTALLASLTGPPFPATTVREKCKSGQDREDAMSASHEVEVGGRNSLTSDDHLAPLLAWPPLCCSLLET